MMCYLTFGWELSQRPGGSRRKRTRPLAAYGVLFAALLTLGGSLGALVAGLAVVAVVAGLGGLGLDGVEFFLGGHGLSPFRIERLMKRARVLRNRHRRIGPRSPRRP